jgi:uncharacterized cupredoxin-like copper-binding protein/Cu/Ag efflux protein CusF
MNTIKLIAACACLTWISATFAHENAPHSAVSTVKEQKDWGIGGDAKQVKRTVKLTLSDTMRFTPDLITVKEGETIRLVMHNSGKLLHELVIGTKKELEDHAALMLKFPNMEHNEPYMAHVQPGHSGDIIWTFNRAGDFEFACLMAGHFQAGMVGKINVAALADKTPATASTASTAPVVVAKAVTPVQLATPPEPAPLKDPSDGEIRKFDKDAKKITLKHGPIKNLDMPGMTMVFQVRDAALLEQLSQMTVGDKIKFNAEEQQGGMVVTGAERVVKK